MRLRTRKFEPKLQLNLPDGQLSARANLTTSARMQQTEYSPPAAGGHTSRPAELRPWVHNWGVPKVPHLGHNLLWGRGGSMPSEERAAAEVARARRAAKPRPPSSASPRALAAASILHRVVSDALLSGPRASNQPSSARCEAWVLRVLRSISDPRFFDEPDDSRLIPALDSWLDARSTALYTGIGRPLDSFDEHGVTLLHVAACFGKVQLVRCLLRRGADFNRASHLGRTAVVYACMGPNLPRQKLAIVRMLLHHGARDGLGLALEMACLLGRESLVCLLSEHGALPRGQVVRFLGHTSGELGASSLPDYEWAMGKVRAFDHSRGKYCVQIICVAAGGGYGRHPSALVPPRRHTEVDVVPAGIRVSLEHVGTERSQPILTGVSSQSSPLDIAAAALAGAASFPKPMRGGDLTRNGANVGGDDERDDRTSVDDMDMPPPMQILQSGPQVRVQILQGASEDACITSSPHGVGMGVGVMGKRASWQAGELSAGPPRLVALKQELLDAVSSASAAGGASTGAVASTSQPPKGTVSATVAAAFAGTGASLPEGTVVRVSAARNELWLRRRIGRIHAYDRPTCRYVVILSPRTTSKAGDSRAHDQAESARSSPIAIMLLPDELEVVAARGPAHRHMNGPAAPLTPQHMDGPAAPLTPRLAPSAPPPANAAHASAIRPQSAHPTATKGCAVVCNASKSIAKGRPQSATAAVGAPAQSIASLGPAAAAPSTGPPEKKGDWRRMQQWAKVRQGVAFSAAAKKEQHPPPTGHIAVLTLIPPQKKSPRPAELPSATGGASTSTEASSNVGGSQMDECLEDEPHHDHLVHRLHAMPASLPKKTYLVNIIEKGGEWRAAENDEARGL